jgi:hypothetical protein
MDKPYLKMQPSEQAVLHAASRIFAAFIASGQVHAGNEKAWMDKSLDLAVKLARKTDRSVLSDGESG